MPRLFISRLFETLFRRLWLFALPVVLLVAVGVVSILGGHATYASVGVILVNRQTILSEISGINSASNNAFGTNTPGGYTSNQINTLLGTDQFLSSVATAAGVSGAIEAGTTSNDALRRSISASAAGESLVAIKASTADPELSNRLAQATIDSYIAWEVENLNSDAASAADALRQQAASQEQVVASLEKAGASVTDLEQARTQLAQINSKLDQVVQAGQQTQTDIAQRLRVIDEPTQASSPESRRKKDVQTMVLYLFLGLLVSGAALVVATLMDRSVRFADEIEARLHLPVLGALPDSRPARSASAV